MDLDHGGPWEEEYSSDLDHVHTVGNVLIGIVSTSISTISTLLYSYLDK